MRASLSRRIPSLVAALYLMVTTAQAAGLRLIDIPADREGPAMTGAVWSPCAAPAADVIVGNATLPGVKDCPIAADKLPLVVVSHGRRGSFRGHHDTAEMLADAGFLVAAINHPGDNSVDASQTDDLNVLIERPADIKRLTDFMLGIWPEAAKVDPERIGLFGFSRGGYTGLVVIGGNPDFRAGLGYMCPPEAMTRKCEQIRDNEVPAEPFVHDPRIKAAVIVDPAFAILFSRDGLKGVTIPVQLWRSALGGDGVVPEGVAALRGRFSARPDYRVVANSSHFSFVAPCTLDQAKASSVVCSDPPGFDRTTFHREFDVKVLAFFRRHLAEAAKHREGMR
jgi:predicted dienelactone hydrolase